MPVTKNYKIPTILKKNRKITPPKQLFTFNIFPAELFPY